jgi:hypothetical protein
MDTKDQDQTPHENEFTPFNPFESIPPNSQLTRDQLVTQFNGMYGGKNAVKVGFSEETVKHDYTGVPRPVIMRQVDVTTDESTQESSFESNSLVIGSLAGQTGENASKWGTINQGEFSPVDQTTQQKLEMIVDNTIKIFTEYRKVQPSLGSIDFNVFFGRKYGVNFYDYDYKTNPPTPKHRLLPYIRNYTGLSLKRKSFI